MLIYSLYLPHLRCFSLFLLGHAPKYFAQGRQTTHTNTICTSEQVIHPRFYIPNIYPLCLPTRVGFTFAILVRRKKNKHGSVRPSQRNDESRRAKNAVEWTILCYLSCLRVSRVSHPNVKKRMSANCRDCLRFFDECAKIKHSLFFKCTCIYVLTFWV